MITYETYIECLTFAAGDILLRIVVLAPNFVNDDVEMRITPPMQRRVSEVNLRQADL
jgi:hypothetical protein